MATRAQRRKRSQERNAAKQARLATRAIASKRADIAATVQRNRPPSPAELQELRAWRGITDSTTHFTQSGVARECSNRPRVWGDTDRNLAALKARIDARMAD